MNTTTGLSTPTLEKPIHSDSSHHHPHAQFQLTDFLTRSTLQEIQDGFTAVTGLEAVIIDPDGSPVTDPSNCQRLTERHEALRNTLLRDLENPANARFEVPIVAEGHRVGAFLLTGQKVAAACEHYRREAGFLADRFAVEPEHRDEFIAAVEKIGSARQSESIRFVFLLADTIAEVCRQEITLRQRVQEMTTLYRLSTLLAEQRDLKQVLDTVVTSTTEVMNVKAASIRLLEPTGTELRAVAVHNLSSDYMDKGPILLAKSVIDQQAMTGEVVYVPDMTDDPRVLYPDDARREGIVSILCAGMIYHGKPIGVMRIYSDEIRTFSDFEYHLLSALAQLAAAAIHNARLEADRHESRRVQRQVQLAVDVQRRLMPQVAPTIPHYEVGARYEPCFELGGDFYDFIPFEHTLGIVVGDVVGKGVAASLLMASVRASFRAHAENTYDLDQIMAKVNASLTRDTRDFEFATVFYGTLDAQSLRLTYSSAGHDPAFLLRNGKFENLSVGGTVLGISLTEHYDKGLIDLKPGDVLFIYTDGVPDAMNFDNQKFGRQRIRDAILAVADQPAQRIADHILWEVRRFIGLNKPSDDMTLVAIKVK